jgi:hypothetical protein
MRFHSPLHGSKILHFLAELGKLRSSLSEQFKLRNAAAVNELKQPGRRWANFQTTWPGSWQAAVGR